jgi:hypothetical protein
VAINEKQTDPARAKVWPRRKEKRRKKRNVELGPVVGVGMERERG